ncbi:hypothetical protein ACTA71_002144 [Dictyostelium dimigraforme]
MSETQEFWLISAPNLPGADIFDQVNQKTAKENSLSENKKFNTPALRVGTLNSLITLNDELQKIDTIVESTTKKIAKQLVDLVGTKPGKDKSLSINGHTIPQYLQQFGWDDAKYNLKLSLQEIVEKISSDNLSAAADYRLWIFIKNSAFKNSFINDQSINQSIDRSINQNLTIKMGINWIYFLLILTPIICFNTDDYSSNGDWMI